MLEIYYNSHAYAFTSLERYLLVETYEEQINLIHKQLF